MTKMEKNTLRRIREHLKIAVAFLFLFLSPVGCGRQDRTSLLNDCMLGDFQTAIQACTKFMESGALTPQKKAGLITLRAWALAQHGDLDLSLQDFSKAIELAPDASAAYLLRATIYTATSREDLAKADYQTAAKLTMHSNKEAQQDPLQHYAVGLALQVFGTTRASISAFNLALQTDPNLPAVYAMRGEILGSEPENAAKGLEDLDKAIALDPRFSAAYLRKAQYFEKLGRKDQALANFDKAIEYNPRYAAAYLGRSQLRIQQKDYPRAIADFSKAMECYASPYWLRAQAYKGRPGPSSVNPL